jgi:hypothetical protein
MLIHVILSAYHDIVLQDLPLQLHLQLTYFGHIKYLLFNYYFYDFIIIVIIIKQAIDNF